MTYVVESYDAFEPPGPNAYIKRGEYGTAAEALAAARKIVDDQLVAMMRGGRSAADALDLWRHAGEVPIVIGQPDAGFDAHAYAEGRADELAREQAQPKG